MALPPSFLARLSLQARISLLLNALLVLFALTLAGLAVQNARSSVREEMEAASKVTQHLLRFVIEREARADTLPGAPADGSRLVELLNRLGRVRAQEIFLFDAAGAALYRSPPPTYKAGRDAPQWFFDLIAPRVDGLRLPVGGLTLEVHANPSRAVVDAWDDTRLLAGIVGTLLVLINLLVRRLVSGSLRGLPKIAVAMSAMEAGQLTARLPPLDTPELDRLGQAFNRMAAALEASRTENRLLSADQAVAQLVQQRLDEERLAIARELHDELGQCVTAVRAIAMSIAHRTEKTLPEVHGGALSIVTVAGSLYDAVHAIVARLRPAALARLGLSEGLREWLLAWQAAHPGRQVELSTHGDLAGVPAKFEVAVFRIVQEALSNAVRHGSARHLRVHIESDADGLSVKVSDDGCGFAPGGHPARGFGLLGMEERARELGGSLQIDSRQGQGTQVLASFPREEEEQ